MAKNIVKNEGALDFSTRKIINDNFADVSRVSTQFLVDSGSTGTTLTAVSGLVTDTLAPGTYYIELNLITTATSNSGFKASLKQGTSSMISSMALSVSGRSAAAIANTTFTTTTDNTAFISATTAYVNVTVKGTLVVSAAGTIQLYAAQNASHADDTTIEVGSTMMVRKIG